MSSRTSRGAAPIRDLLSAGGSKSRSRTALRDSGMTGVVVRVVRVVRGRFLRRSTGPQRLGDGAVVEPVEFAPHRHAARQHGDGDAGSGQAVGEIVGGGL